MPPSTAQTSHAPKRRSKRKLKPADARRFTNLAPGLFVDLANVVCATGVMPHKELHECWQMAASVQAEFPDIPRVTDLAAGHGLLAWILVLLAHDGERPARRTAVAVDIKRPKSADVLSAAMVERWPQLADAVHYVEASIEAAFSDDGPGTLFVAAHACGGLSDRVLLAALRSGSPVAVMPCCHSLRKQRETLAQVALAAGLDAGVVGRIGSSETATGLSHPLAIDRFRIEALQAAGYSVCEASIEPEISAYHRIIMGRPKVVVDPRRHADSRAESESTCTPPRRGGSRSYEEIRTLNVASLDDARRLALRPSSTWRRSMDLSFWVANDETGHCLGAALESLLAKEIQDRGETWRHAVSFLDRYADPATSRVAFTYRVDLTSSNSDITKGQTADLRKSLRAALAESDALVSGDFEPRFH